jgi:ABC-type Zn uptake system ZnuABC Zn-binding protein ZnuA
MITSPRSITRSPITRPPAVRWRRAAGALAALVTLAACGSAGASTTSPSEPDSTSAPVAADALNVVVSDVPIANLASLVAGPNGQVSSVVPPGADGHTYEPRPEDARTLAEADVYFENGMGLNNVVTEFATTNYPAGTPHFVLAESIPENEIIYADTAEEIAAHGHAHKVNAHFWPDPSYAADYVFAIQTALTQIDPANEAGYASRAQALLVELEAMDAAIRTAIDTIPAENRQLVVYHDSWSYFGRRYGLPVVGAIQPTDFSEPSAAELRATIDQVNAAGVPAFFGSEVFPSDVLDVIAQETGAEYVADLSDDRLPGEAGSPEHSYIGMMVANARTIVEALGGDPSALDAVDPARA